MTKIRKRMENINCKSCFWTSALYPLSTVRLFPSYLGSLQGFFKGMAVVGGHIGGEDNLRYGQRKANKNRTSPMKSCFQKMSLLVADGTDGNPCTTLHSVIEDKARFDVHYPSAMWSIRSIKRRRPIVAVITQSIKVETR